MNTSKTKVVQLLSALIFVFMLLRFFFYIFSSVPFIEKSAEENEAQLRENHVLVIGEAQDCAFLSDVFKGAESVSAYYNCVTELIVPQSYAEGENIESLLEYASLVEPDGIIACIPEREERIFLPEGLVDMDIPIITLSNYRSDIKNVAHIGTNQSELGRKIALEGTSCLFLSGKTSGTIAIVSLSPDFKANYSTLMSSLQNTLSRFENINSFVLDFSPSDDFQTKSEALRHLFLKDEPDIILCPSSQDTIRVSQIATELHKDGSVGIIGFGSGEILETYLNKGTVSELLSIDSEKIGRTAMQELFEYIKSGYANNYIMSDVQVKRSAK